MLIETIKYVNVDSRYISVPLNIKISITLNYLFNNLNRKKVPAGLMLPSFHLLMMMINNNPPACVSSIGNDPSPMPEFFTGSSIPVFENFTLPPEEPLDISSTTTATTPRDNQERIYQGLNDKLIPIYCSILAAVVVGLVAFIIFKK